MGIKIKQITVPTVKVIRKEDGAECFINATDFDSALYDKVETKRVAPRRPAPKKEASE